MSDLSNKNNARIPLATVCLVLLTCFAFLFVARELRAILIPFFIAIFIALLFQPLIEKASAWGIPKLIAILFYLALTVVAILLLGRFLLISIKNFALSFNAFIPRMTSIMTEIYNNLDIPHELRDEFSFSSLISQYIGTISTTLLNFTNSSINFATQFFLVLLFTIFLLMEFRNFSYKFSTAFSNDTGKRLREVGLHIALQISHYLAVKTFISALTGLAIYISLKIIGVNFAAMWGIVGFILNYIPTVGSALVMIMTMSMGFIQFYPEPGPIIATFIMMPLIQTILGQFLDPRMQGKSLDVSPFLILLSLAIWGWVWGIPGMFISVPLTVAIKVIMANFGPFKPIAALMSVGTPPKNSNERPNKNLWRNLFSKKKD